MVVPVIALTAIVLIGILSKFRKYMILRDQLDAEFLREQAEAESAAAAKAAANVVRVQTRRHAA